MIVGTVTEDGIPYLMIEVAGRQWTAVVDTGFNGDLELPDALLDSVSATLIGPIESVLAANQNIVEDLYAVDFEFDGEQHRAEATFVDVDTILIGTRLLRMHRLEIDFPGNTLCVERVE